jgi:hypothetical protein
LSLDEALRMKAINNKTRITRIDSHSVSETALVDHPQPSKVVRVCSWSKPVLLWPSTRIQLRPQNRTSVR